MAKLVATYKIPEMRHIFLVFALDGDKSNRSTESEKQKKCLASVLDNKYLETEKKNRPWRIRLIHEDDFLEIIQEQTGIVKCLTNPTIENSEYMELLAINIKTEMPHHDSLASCTPKVLDRVSKDDVIEFFI
jgi:hypothetical protein